MADASHELATTGFWKQFTWDDVVVAIVVHAIAEPINIAAGEAFVNLQNGREWFGWAYGIPLAVIGTTFHWWKRWILPVSVPAWIGRNGGWLIFIALLALSGSIFYYVASPGLYSRTKYKTDEQIAQHPPANPADTPTWVRLSFDKKGMPTQIESHNIHWWWVGRRQFADQYGNSQGLACDVFENFGCGVAKTMVATILFLSFDVPVAGTPSLKFSSVSPPQWELSKRIDDRIIVILLYEYITNGTLEIQIK